jgi:hypothetical protein
VTSFILQTWYLKLIKMIEREFSSQKVTTLEDLTSVCADLGSNDCSSQDNQLLASRSTCILTKLIICLCNQLLRHSRLTGIWGKAEFDSPMASSLSLIFVSRSYIRFRRHQLKFRRGCTSVKAPNPPIQLLEQMSQQTASLLFQIAVGILPLGKSNSHTAIR